MRFVGLALNICTIIDEMIKNAPIVMITLGLLINLLIISFFVYLAIKAKKKELWAYKLALILYCVDTMLIFVLPFENKVANLILHIFVIWLVLSEFKEYKNYFILERDLYLPDWALSEQSNVLFIKKLDFELQQNDASQIVFYKKALLHQEQNRPVSAIENYSKAIGIWKCIPIAKNKDKDWYAMALMNRALLEKSIRSRNINETLKDFILAYYNFKTVIEEDVKLTIKNQYMNYDYVSKYFTQCTYHLLTHLKQNLNNEDILKYGEIVLGIKSVNVKYFLNEIYIDSFNLFDDYQIDIWENYWTSRILLEMPSSSLDNFTDLQH